jgi:acyl dehydratase
LGIIEGTAQALMGVDWKFKQPIFIGDTIRVRAAVVKKRQIKRLGGGLVVFEVSVVNQGDEVAQEGRWTALIKGKPSE